MRKLIFLSLLASFAGALVMSSSAVTREELARRFKALPTVAEEDLPEMRNERGRFPGVVKLNGLSAHTWVRFPFVENPGSFGFDRQGALYVAEANRFWLGVPDLRGANELVRGDFQAVTVQDRQKLYDQFADRFPEGWFNAVADRVIRLEDRDGNGAADARTLFSDQFNGTLDGIGFSVLADDDSVYFTCIPNLWKMTDEDGDGVADRHETLAEGFGVRVSFIGHDLHGVVRGPDGRLYFSVGDRGYHVTTQEGEVLANSGRGAVFRCESDGSGLEEVCVGLRNPQELAFDDHGNLFTFDNTGDIGDLARMVYILEGTDSGWDMSHQSAHQYRTMLDWGDFHPESSMWVQERMYDLHHEEQPQWVYPPASHVARGPSGVTWLTGNSLPENLRNKFLLANYRGASENCTVLLVGVKPAGAGFVAESEEILLQGVGASDVELGFDGNIYICDYGGGWSVNENGAIHVLEPSDQAAKAVGKETAELVAQDWEAAELDSVRELLRHPDRRVRQFAQFELVERIGEGRPVLEAVAADESEVLTARLHALWGLGQLGRKGDDVFTSLLDLLQDSDAEVRANAARTLGDLRWEDARNPLLTLLEDESPRVVSLAAIALGRICSSGDKEASEALYAAGRANGEGELDLVVRHSLLSALDRIGCVKTAAKRVKAKAVEERLLAVLVLRRHESEALAGFWNDPDAMIRREVIRAIYDTSLVDSKLGERLADLKAGVQKMPVSLQRRVVAANFRRGELKHGRNLMGLARNIRLDMKVRKAALQGLLAWEREMATDPVHGHYRPLPNPKRSLTELGTGIESGLRAFLGSEDVPELVALGLKLADETGVRLDESTLRDQVVNRGLSPEVRAATLDSLVRLNAGGMNELLEELLEDPAEEVQAAAFRHGFALGMEGMSARASEAIRNARLQVARAAVAGQAQLDVRELVPWWKGRESTLRPELWLDVFLALNTAEEEEVKAEAAAFAAASPYHVFGLSEAGGDAGKGEVVFRNQGACLQCHKVGSEGGIQGPSLTRVAERLDRKQLLQSIYDPGAVITKGYGSSNVTLKDGTVLFGRVAQEQAKSLVLIGLDGKEMELQRSDIQTVTPPVSAMPPLGAMLPPRDLRDLVAYLASLTPKNQQAKDAAKHGEEEGEAIAK